MQNRMNHAKGNKSSKEFSSKNLQDVHDEMLKTGFPKKSKFISKNTENAKRAITRYDKDQYTPGNLAQNISKKKNSLKR